MKLKLIMLVSLIAFGFAATANAGNVADLDGDLVPDSFDNCDNEPNGPNDGSNQVDTDQDGYGNACDGDFDNDFGVQPSDFTLFLLDFGGTGTLTDLDGDGGVTPADFSIFLQSFGGSPGTSGLACAGVIPCTP